MAKLATVVLLLAVHSKALECVNPPEQLDGKCENPPPSAVQASAMLQLKAQGSQPKQSAAQIDEASIDSDSIDGELSSDASAKCGGGHLMYSHLEEARTCLPAGLAEKHLEAVRHHAASLANFHLDIRKVSLVKSNRTSKVEPSGPIRWTTHPNKCIDVTGGGTANGNALGIFDCKNDGTHSNMQWTLPSSGSGPIRWSTHPTKCFDVKGGSTATGTPIALYDCVDDGTHCNMQWTVPSSGSGPIRWTTHPNLCIDVYLGGTGNQNPIAIHECVNGGTHFNMQWTVPQLCGPNENVVSHVCTACPPGTTSTGTHTSGGADTQCDAAACGPNEKVVNHVCTACPAGKTSTGSHDASGSDTACDATSCGPEERVVNHACEACPAGATSTGNHDASGPDTLCEAIPVDAATTAGEESANIVTDNAAGVGNYGGSCTCPDGKVYQVGDTQGTDCASLACVNGVSGTCHRSSGEWSKRKVVCLEAATDTAPAAADTAPAAADTAPAAADTAPAAADTGGADKAATDESLSCQSSLAMDAKVGDTTLEVIMDDCFQKGQEYILEGGSSEEEVVTIAGFGSLVLQSPLTKNHAAGAVLQINGATAPLNAAGFKAVTSLCCPPEMELFFTRLLDSMGLDVCSKPHVQGLMHWFTCVPAMDYQYVVDVINNGNPCKFWGPLGSTCPELSEQCQGEFCR